MMRKIVIHRDPRCAATQLEPALDALEARQGIDGHRGRHADVAGRCDRGQCVGSIVPPGKRHHGLAEALSRERENRLVRRGALGGQPAVRPIEPFELGPAAPLDHPLQAGLGTVGENATITRHDPNQMMELGLDRRQIGEDVRVIELEVVQDGGARPVMNEFRTLVAESGVVFVRFDDEEG